MHSRKVEVFL